MCLSGTAGHARQVERPLRTETQCHTQPVMLSGQEAVKPIRHGPTQLVQSGEGQVHSGLGTPCRLRPGTHRAGSRRLG
jgi:hypothetical protein